MKIEMESLFADDNCVARDDLQQLINFKTPNAELDDAERRECVRLAFGVLEPRERAVLELKFGFESDPHSYAEIGKKMNISKQRVGQLVEKAEKNVQKIINKLTKSKDGNNY
jgi:RNA polymerase sigma factor (sigma-70 family)